MRSCRWQPSSRSSGNRAVEESAPAGSGAPLEVLWVALKLGLTSFGGPIAHLGYFERTYVRQRHWLTDEHYGGLVALCQLLPGPTSSQVGFLIGLHRAGWLGALAAWIGFTLPSAGLMYGFALFTPASPGVRARAFLHGLMLTAVVVVAQAVWSMARTLAPDLPRRLIAILTCLLLLFQPDAAVQLGALIGGAIAGALICRSASRSTLEMPVAPHPRAAWAATVSFVLLLAGLSVASVHDHHSPMALASLFYRSGALVFGGGHVVLPLLQQALVPGGWLSDDRFLAGYGFAQAMPGPLFTLAAYLGAVSSPSHVSLLWALLALIAVFLPGLLLAISGPSALSRLANNGAAAAAAAGVNAAVVGLLAAALYHPVWTGAVHSVLDVVIVIAAFVLLQRFKIPPILVAALCVGVSVGKSMVASQEARHQRSSLQVLHHQTIQYRTPCSARNASARAPCSSASVDRSPASLQLLAATVTERGAPTTGQPVRGSRT